MREFWNVFSQQLKPRFNEISTYLIALSFCWLFIFHTDLRYGFYMFFTGFESMSPFFLFLGLLVTCGLLLSIIHVFVKRKKLAFEKAIMGWTILGISGVTSFLAGIEMLPSRSSMAVVIVAWNILMSILLLLQMGMQRYEISDMEASSTEVVATTAILVVILLLSDIVLQFSWAVTLSLCIFYSTSVVFIITWFIHRFNLQSPEITE